jgi:hypothetical protein
VYSSPNIIQVIKSRRIRWKEMWGNGEVHTGIWWKKFREGDHLANPGVDGRIILKYILK